MAQHRTSRSLRRALPALLALLLAVGLAAAPAGAATARLRVVGQDTVDKYNCQFTVSSVNTANNTLTGKIAGNAFPTSLFSSIVRNEVICELGNENGSVLATLDAAANHASVSRTITVTVPLGPSYSLCGGGDYTTRNGTTGFLPVTCQTG